jgi:hypothetical protein
MRLALSGLLVLVFLFCSAGAWAQVAVIMEEPYALFGAMNPTGHAAVYLARVCSESPTELRRCKPGELGVVISRYHRVGGYDWIAIPLIPYLYAVESLDKVPAQADIQTEDVLRDAWRRQHLEAIIPNLPAKLVDSDASVGTAKMVQVSDPPESANTSNDNSAELKRIENKKPAQDRPTAIERMEGTPSGEWYELVGVAYDRKLYGFELDTTAAQDDAFIAAWNDRRNNAHFNLLFRNCADFARNVLDFYYPHSVHRNWIADAGMTTPKQVAKAVVHYGRKHPELHLTVFEVPQVPGSIKRSHHTDGAIEALVKSKKYMIPLAIINPYVAGSLVVVWAVDGRFKVPNDAPGMTQLEPANVDKGRTVLKATPDAAGKSGDPTTTAPAPAGSTAN